MSSVRVDQVCLRFRAALFQEFEMAVRVDDRGRSKLGRTAPK